MHTLPMSKVLTHLPADERVGIAFSAGLDTSVAVAWMRAQGAVPWKSACAIVRNRRRGSASRTANSDTASPIAGFR